MSEEDAERLADSVSRQVGISPIPDIWFWPIRMAEAQLAFGQAMFRLYPFWATLGR